MVAEDDASPVIPPQTPQRVSAPKATEEDGWIDGALFPFVQAACVLVAVRSVLFVVMITLGALIANPFFDVGRIVSVSSFGEWLAIATVGLGAFISSGTSLAVLAIERHLRK